MSVNTHTYISLNKLERFLNKLKSAHVFVQTITQGSTNGTISVDGANIPVKGLGTAAYTSTPTLVSGTANGTVAFNGTDIAVKGLGSAAYTASTNYATASQGAKADTAVQPAALNAVSADVDNYSSWYKYEEDEE